MRTSRSESFPGDSAARHGLTVHPDAASVGAVAGRLTVP